MRANDGIALNAWTGAAGTPRTCFLGDGRMKKELVRYSKFLSLVLRHDPGVAGLQLDREGWADVDRVLAASAACGFPGDVAILREVVATNDKRRFAFSADGRKIRARQGHSLVVDLGLAPQRPPQTLYHGTAEHFLASILDLGLQAGKRQYVHLCRDARAATRVGRRHGRPVVLCVDAASMHRDGHEFFLSENGVWLTTEVPPRYLAQVGPEDAEHALPADADKPRR
jgi:putative RNA 2'-phosphotransferase